MQCTKCKIEFDQSTSSKKCPTCADHHLKTKLRRQYTYKAWVYSKLGGKCNNCGNEDYRVLTIDHINSDAMSDVNCLGGSKQTRDSRWYIAIWKFLNQSGSYPHDLQLLCMNCHMIKDIYKHQSFQEYCESRVSPLLMSDFKPHLRKLPPKSE